MRAAYRTTDTRGWPLKTYFALLACLCTLAAAGAAVYVYVQSDRDARGAAERDARFAARTVAGQIGDGVALLRTTVGQLAKTPGIEQAFTKPEACSLSFAGPDGLGAGHLDILRADGTVACSSRRPQGSAPLPDYRGAEWLARARRGEAFLAPVADPATGGHSALSAAPIKGGIVAGFLALEPAGPGLAKLYGGGRPVDFLLTTADRKTVLARSVEPERWVGASLAGNAFLRDEDQVERRGLGGRTARLYAEEGVPGVGWRFYAGEDKETALAASGRLRDRQLLIILLGLALVFASIAAIYRRVAVPVSRLRESVRAGGEAETLTPVPASGPLEVQALGASINELIGSVNSELAERRRAEDSARASERNYRLLFERSPVPMWVHDAEHGAILEVNDAAVARYGYSHDEFLGLTMDGLAVDGDATRHRHADGSTIEVRAIGHPVTFAGRAARFVLAEDVGERERLEAQLRQAQRMEAIGRLAGGVAHDFNNLLTAVLGYADLLLAITPPDDRRRAYIEEVKTAGERSAALTRQLLTLGRGQALEPVVLDVNEVVVAIEPMLRRLVRANVAIETRLDAEQGRARADRGQVEQVLVNLVVNGSDAMPHGGRLTIATAVRTLDETAFPGAPGRYVALAVSDTGVGMDEATIAHVFEPFFTTKAREEGTGLGLATVYAIVRQAGGLVSVDSELGRGTSFTVFLPLVEAAVDQAGPGSRPALTFDAGGVTALLVEDDPPVRAVVRRMLETHGFAVLEASDGEQALSLSRSAETGAIELLVADSVIPGPGGIALAEQIRARHPAVRTLVMSGYSRRDGEPDVALTPGTEFVAKPFSASDLVAKLVTLLGTAKRP